MTEQGFDSDARMARPVGADVHDAAAAPPVFPRVAMSRRDAVLEVLVVAGLIALYDIVTGAAGLHEALHALVPRGGLYVAIFLNGLFCLGVVSGVLLLRRRGPADLGLVGVAARRLMLSVAAAVPACYVLGLLAVLGTVLVGGRDLMDLADRRTGFLERISDIPVSWVVPVVLFVGVYEEILFRGFLLPRLRAILGGDWPAIILSAALFGLAHYPSQGLEGAVQTGTVGLVLAYLVVRTGSLWPAILTHAAIDGLSLLLTMLLLPYMQEALAAPATQPTSGL